MSDVSSEAGWRAQPALGIVAVLLALVVAWAVAMYGPTEPTSLVVASSCAIVWTGSFAVVHLVARARAWLWVPALAALGTAACVSLMALRETGAVAAFVLVIALVPASFGLTHAAEARGLRATRGWQISVILTLIALLGFGVLFVLMLTHVGGG